MSSRLLQLAVLRHHRQSVSASTVGAECGSPTGTKRSDHITPVLRELHWLPVRQSVDVKLAVLVYKAHHDLTAPYRRTASARHRTGGISTATENVRFCLRETSALSDFCFRAPYKYSASTTAAAAAAAVTAIDGSNWAALRFCCSEP